LAGGFTGLLILWGLMGCAQSGIFPCATKTIGEWFPTTERAFASGMLACCMAMGAAIAPVVTGAILGPLNWQWILALYAVPGLIWAVAFGLFMPQSQASVFHATRETPNVANGVRWKKLLIDPHMQLLCLQQFLRAGATVFFFTWFPRFLQETRGMGEQEAGLFAAGPLLGGMLGGLVGGMLSDWLLKRTGNPRLSRQGLAVVAMLTCATVATIAFFVADPFIAVMLISVGACCGYIGGVAAYATAITMGGRQVATVFATMNMCGNIGGALFPIAVGWIVVVTGNWNLALLLFASLFAADAVCWALLNPKGTLFDDTDDAEPDDGSDNYS
jgi:nitrate/nitrite transporter NarK